MRYKTKYTFEQRKVEAKKALSKYSDRVPVIIERSERATIVPDIDRAKFLVPKDLHLSQLSAVIRSRAAIPTQHAIFLFVNDSVLASGSKTVGELYDTHSSECGLLFVTYCDESTFGNRAKTVGVKS